MSLAFLAASAMSLAILASASLLATCKSEALMPETMAEILARRKRVEASAMSTAICAVLNFHSAHPTGWAESISGNGVCMCVCVHVRHHFKDDWRHCLEASLTGITIHILKAHDDSYSKIIKRTNTILFKSVGHPGYPFPVTQSERITVSGFLVLLFQRQKVYWC